MINLASVRINNILGNATELEIVNLDRKKNVYLKFDIL